MVGCLQWTPHCSGIAPNGRAPSVSIRRAPRPPLLAGAARWYSRTHDTGLRTEGHTATAVISRSSQPGWLPRSGPPRARARMRADACLRAPAAHPGAASERCKLCVRASPGRGRGSAAKAHHGAVAASAGHAQVVDPALGGPRRVAAVVAKAARLWPQARDHPALSRVYTYLCAHG